MSSNAQTISGRVAAVVDAARLPPGPRSTLVSTYRFSFDPVNAYRDWVARYGRVFMLPMIDGKTVCIADPELLRRIFANEDPDRFDANIPEPLDVLIGSRSLLRLAGAEHQRERKLMAPPFHGERMRGWAPIMAAATRRAFAPVADGQVFRALDRTKALTLDIIVSVAFGVGRAQAGAFCQAIHAMMQAIHPSFLFTRATQRDLGGLLPYKRFRLASERVDALLYAHIASVRAELEQRPGSRNDVLSMMIEARYDDGSAMSDQTIRDELRLLVAAGHESTAITLAWALYYLHKPENLALRARVLDEIERVDSDDLDGLTRLPYLQAVVQETLRIRPVGAQCFRKLRSDWEVDGWRLPAGATLALLIWTVHHDGALWPEPERFRPERFLERRPAPHEFLPFGGGTTRCIGAAFARYEAALAVATLLRSHEFELLDHDVRCVRETMTLAPRGGVRMRITAQRGQS
jgi:cytochrome P450 family 110